MAAICKLYISIYIHLNDIQNGEPVYLSRSLSVSASGLEVALCQLTYYHQWLNIGTALKNNEIEGPELDPIKSNTQNTQHHEACSYCYVVVRCDGHNEPSAQYRGPRAAERFLQALQEEEEKLKTVLANPKPIWMSPEDWGAYKRATTCHVCQKPLDGDSVRDHCHITGKYRGAKHNACNLKLRLNPKITVIPVVFHNLRGNDSLADARHLEGRRPHVRHPQHHGEVLLLHWSAPIHR